MTSPDDQLKSLLDECSKLESEAGITAAAEKAEEGRFIPLGAFGEEASSDEYFADEHDHFRKHIRDAYFSVADTSLRKRLIAARRKVDAALRQSFASDVSKAKIALVTTKARLGQLPWLPAALLAVAIVCVGYWVFGVVGAIAGAVGGFFLAQGVIHSSKVAANATIKEATDTVSVSVENQAKNTLHPDCFSHSEEITGDRNQSFDYQSALGNVRSHAKHG